MWITNYCFYESPNMRHPVYVTNMVYYYLAPSTWWIGSFGHREEEHGPIYNPAELEQTKDTVDKASKVD